MKFECTTKLPSVSTPLICCAERKFSFQKTIPIYALIFLLLALFTNINSNEVFAKIDKGIQSLNENSISKPKLTKTNDTTGEVKQEWVAIYNGVGGLRNDEALDIAVDSFGNVYITGYSQGLSYDYDCATIKYNSHGEVIWINRYDGSYDDYAYKLALDDSGNVYITGSSYSPDSEEDYLTIKYNTDGDEQWVRKYNGPGNSFDKANDLAIDEAGNVYVTGESNGIGTYRDYATIKYNSLGIEQWIKRYNGPNNSNDEAVALSIDNSGNILVTGKSSGSNNSYNFATIKYSTNGEELWVQRFTTLGNYPDWPYDITLDNLGNVIVTGTGASLDSTSFAPDYLTIKYDSSGIQLWYARYNGPGGDFDEAKIVAVDDSGNIYITGWSIGEGGRHDIATIKYNSVGIEQWVRRYNRGFVYDLATDKAGNVYVTGISADSTIDYTTIKYDSDGTEQWIIKYNSYGLNMATAIALDDASNVYVTGILEVPGGIPTFDYGTIKYSQRIVPVELTNFTAFLTNNHIILNWQTAIETNNSGFEIQRKKSENSSQESDWGKVGFVAGYGTTTEFQSYKFEDNDVSYGVYYYRLKQIDFDGSFEYSSTIEILVSDQMAFFLEQNYPNPFNSVTTINFSIAKPSFVVLKVYNTLGEEVAVLLNEEKDIGKYSLRFNAQALPSDVYFYKLNASGTYGEYNFVKKFILLK